MPMPTSVSLKASVSMAENIMLKRIGARTHPCFTPFETGNGWDISQLSWALASMPSWSCCTMATNFWGHLYFAMILQRPSLLTVSKALVRSTYMDYRSAFCSWHFSWSCLAVNTMSIVPNSFWKPHWLSGRKPLSRCTMRWLSGTLARALPAMESREILRWLSQAWQFPLHL